MKKNRTINLYIYLGILFLVSVVVTPFISGEYISISDIFSGTSGSTDWFVLLNLRIPRLILAILAGGGLAIVGLVYQALLQNPLASPYTLGIASGSSLGAVIGIHLFRGDLILARLGIVGFAFIGAALTIFLVFGLSKKAGNIQTGFLILGGVAISYFFSSVISTIFYFSDYTDTFQMIRWMMGGIEIVGYKVFLILIPALLIGFIILIFNLKSLNIISASEVLAKGKGVNLEKVQKLVFFSSSFITALIVSFSGPIAFIGLISPHISRILLGPGLNKLFLFTFLVGALILIGTDSISRMVFYPMDFPVGIFTGILGGPFFIYLIFKKKQL